MGNIIKKEWRNSDATRKEIIPYLFMNQGGFLCVFDTETTGLEDDAKIIQFSGVRFKIEEDFSLTEYDYFDTYINPEMTLDPKITEITGITDEMLKDKPTEDKVVDYILSYMNGCGLWSAYNQNFDLKKLEHMCKRTNREFVTKPSLDVLVMARDLIPKSVTGNHKLGTITKFLFPNDDSQFHNSLEDVRATARCFEVFVKEYISLPQEEEKTQRFLVWASLWENPYKYDVRIKLNIANAGELGDIYFDCVNLCWECKKTKAAEKLFNDTDISDLERQLLKKYGPTYDAGDIDTLARNWQKAKKSQVI